MFKAFNRPVMFDLTIAKAKAPAIKLKINIEKSITVKANAL